MNSLTIKQFIKFDIQTYFCFLILLALLNPVLAADARGQKLENFKVDLSVKDATVIEVLNEIESQTSFTFVYDRKVKKLENTYDIAYQKCFAAFPFLELMAKDANLIFRRINETISIDVRPKSPIVSIVEIASFKTVTGKVTDLDGVPLPGASVLEKGTLNGTTTDFDGNFTIDVADDAILEIFLHRIYHPRKLQYKDYPRYPYNWFQDATQLDDVVVVGYGVAAQIRCNRSHWFGKK